MQRMFTLTDATNESAFLAALAEEGVEVTVLDRNGNEVRFATDAPQRSITSIATLHGWEVTDWYDRTPVEATPPAKSDDDGDEFNDDDDDDDDDDDESLNIGDTAQSVFSRIADLVDQSPMLPEPRRLAVAATLRQMGEIGGSLALTANDVKLAYHRLSFGRDDDGPKVTVRRDTCREIAALILEDDSAQSLHRVVAVMERIAEHFEHSSDPRHISIRDTARREARELMV
jgi:hypothetical protein